MSLKSQLAIAVGKSSYWFLHKFMHGGTSLPGKITLTIDPDVLKTLAKNYNIIVITGTNGKTLTTALTVEVLSTQYKNILTNPSGSNMKQGIVTSFLNVSKNKNKKLAVIETDEANVPIISKYINPVAYVLTNIFRDQMDRYGEIYTTYKKILLGIQLHPNAKLIVNGDEPLFNSIKLPNPIIYYGFNNKNNNIEKGQKAPSNTDGILCPKCNHIIYYKNRIYANLGDYYCKFCGYKRPKLKYSVEKVILQTPTSSTFDINKDRIKLNIGGTYNIYNALAAYSVGKEFGILNNNIINSLNNDKNKIFGRQEIIKIKNKKINLILVKNPVGLDQVLKMIKTDKNNFSLSIFLNANYADGIDTSWIWDGTFEDLPFSRIPSILVGGERYKDIYFRLQVAGVPQNKLNISQNLDEAFKFIKKMPTSNIYVLATYTAMLQIRKLLAVKGYIKKGIEK